MSRRGGKKVPRLIREVLEGARVEGQTRVSTGVDVIGDIAIVRLAAFGPEEKRKIGAGLLNQLKNVKVVFEQEGGIEGEYRLRRLRHLAGEERTLTLHRENGCVFRVDVAKSYFSPRLSTERLRIAKQVRLKERVLNMFAGVGPFSIAAAKIAGARVTSCEISKFACQLHFENNVLNHVQDRIRVINGDAGELPASPGSKFDRIIMPHPSRANEFLPVALKLAKKGAVIHYYRHVLGRDEDEAEGCLRDELSGVLPPNSRFGTRRVRDVGPRWVEMVADVRPGA